MNITLCKKEKEMYAECELCSEKDSFDSGLPPCDICPHHKVEDNFDNPEKEIEQFQS
jgi:hypothetical protein